jgi:hypothetical protein
MNVDILVILELLSEVLALTADVFIGEWICECKVRSVCVFALKRMSKCNTKSICKCLTTLSWGPYIVGKLPSYPFVRLHIEWVVLTVDSVHRLQTTSKQLALVVHLLYGESGLFSKWDTGHWEMEPCPVLSRCASWQSISRYQQVEL